MFIVSSFGLTLWSLLIIGSSAVMNYENPVPLQIGATTDITCDLPNISNWTFKSRIIEEIEHRKGKKYELLNEKRLLKIHRGDYNDEGNYTCEAGSQRKVFTVKGKPRFKIQTRNGRIDVKSIHANEATDIDMVCFIPNKEEIPQDERYFFKWLKGDKEITAPVENGRELVLRISNITQSDRDLYKCFASNGVQNHTESISLRVKDKLSYIWPCIGIVCEIVILVLTILIFEKRGVKPEAEDSVINTDIKKSS